jgi:DNA polymerase (family X)
MSRRWESAAVAPFAAIAMQRIAHDSDVHQVAVCGSLRRNEPKVGDIDFVVATSNTSSVLRRMFRWHEFARLVDERLDYASAVMNSGLQMDVWFVPPQYFGSALWRYTGSRVYTRHAREQALVTCHRYFDGAVLRDRDGTELAAPTEDIVFALLGVPYVAPESRRC